MGERSAQLQRVDGTRFSLGGTVADYIHAVGNNWTKMAPFSNPGMLEMIRDREHSLAGT